MSSKSEHPLPRVGFLTTEFGVGGAEKVVFELARGLDRNRFELAGVWCLASAEGFYAGEFERMGIHHGGCGARGTIDAPWAVLRLRRILRDARLDLLNAHLFHASLAARLVARGAGVGQLVVSHHFNEQRAMRHRAERFLLGRAQALTAVSATVAELLSSKQRLAPAAVRVIPNGVDHEAIAARVRTSRLEARRRLRVPEDARLVGTVGRLVPEKDPLTLLEAFAQVAAEDPALRLVYVGDGPLHEVVFNRIGELGLRERASIVGFWTDVPGALAAMDVFAISSLSEGHPLALLEAMAAGLPIVASCIAAVEEVLGPEAESALICAPGQPVEFAVAIRKFLGDSDLAARSGAAARARVAQRYSLERMLSGYERLFAELLGCPEATAAPDRGNASEGGRRKGLTAS
jgi:glycosyltransferase involved in cell wall biosynthesis